MKNPVMFIAVIFFLIILMPGFIRVWFHPQGHLKYLKKYRKQMQTATHNIIPQQFMDFMYFTNHPQCEYLVWTDRILVGTINAAGWAILFHI